MKKLALCLLIALLGCTALLAAAEVTDGAVELPEEILPDTLLASAYLIAEDRDELIIMTEEDLYDLIGIAPEDCTDFAYLAHIDSLTGRELIIVNAVDEEAALRIVELLQGYLEIRRHETRNYLPETYRVLCEAEIAQKDMLVVLSIAAPNANEKSLLLGEEKLLTEE